jgi:hypothetical protein
MITAMDDHFYHVSQLLAPPLLIPTNELGLAASSRYEFLPHSETMANSYCVCTIVKVKSVSFGDGCKGLTLKRLLGLCVAMFTSWHTASSSLSTRRQLLLQLTLVSLQWHP